MMKNKKTPQLKLLVWVFSPAVRSIGQIILLFSFLFPIKGLTAQNASAASDDPFFEMIPPIIVSSTNQNNEFEVYLPITLKNQMPSPLVIFKDDFTSDQSWEQVPEISASWELINGELLLSHTEPTRSVRAVAPVPVSNMPVSYSVDVNAYIPTNAAPDSRYGILFDWLDMDRFYLFIVSPSDNTYFIYKFESSWVLLKDGLAQLNDGVNHLRVERNLTNIRVYVNDTNEPLAEVTDTTYSNGQAGIALYTPPALPEGVIAQVAFDNFEISGLPYVFKTGFDGETSAMSWEPVPEADSSLFVMGGEYHLRHTIAGRNVRTIAPPSETDMLTSYSVEVEGYIVPDAHEDTQIGILFDWLSSSQFYWFTIVASQDKFYIYKFDNAWILLHQGDLSAISTKHQLKVERDDNHIRVYAKDMLNPLASISDGTFQHGRTGLVIGSPTDLGAGDYSEAAFDNFIVTALP